MNDTREEQNTVPVDEETAANNNVDGTSDGPNEVEAEAEEASPEARVAALETELADQKDRLLRALAETENVRRRGQREREDAARYAVAGFPKGLPSMADNLRPALASLPAG